MPLPLIPIVLGAASAVAAGFGAKKAYDGYKDTQAASKWHERAKNLFEEASSSLKQVQKTANKSFKKLGKTKTKVIEFALCEYGKIIDSLNLESNTNEINIPSADLKHMQEVRSAIIDLGTAVGGIIASGGAGALAGFGAFGGAGLLASASTGTAISSLSGVAATNATLAWFGGGSLATGGLGMAGGAWVLGGVVAAPVILVAGWVFANSAETKKYDALAYYNAVESVVENMKGEELLWGKAGANTNELQTTIKELNAALIDSMRNIKDIMQNNGNSVSQWDKSEQEKLKAMMQTAETLVNVINKPVLSDDDPTTKRIVELQKESKKLMEDIQDRWGGE